MHALIVAEGGGSFFVRDVDAGEGRKQNGSLLLDAIQYYSAMVIDTQG